jgi:hypothetical protein
MVPSLHPRGLMKRRLALTATLFTALPVAHVRAESVAAPYIVIRDVSVTEGDSGRTRFTSDVTLMSWYQPVEVDIQAFSGTAGAEDYAFPAVHLTLTPGVPQAVSGEVIGDIEVEENETFDLRATGSQGARYVYSAGGHVTIVDDDAARAPRVTIDGARVAEGDDASTRAELTVHLDPPVAFAVEVSYRSADRTASALDYTAVSGTLMFAPGETIKSIAVDVSGDRVWERDETLAVQLTSARRAVISGGEGIVTIANDDPAVSVTIDDLEVAEGDQGRKQVTVAVRLSHPAPPDMKIHATLVGGSAGVGEDFQSGENTLYPAAGATESRLTFDILSDRVPECDEGLTIQYGAVYSGDDTTKTARVLIVNDDGPPGAPCADPYLPGPRPDGGVPDASSDDPPRADSAAPPPATVAEGGGQLAAGSSGCAVASGTSGAPLLLLALLGLLARGRRARG